LLKAYIYIRQSTAREESISSELQETACRAYANAQGYEVSGVVEDIGISGRTFKRPGITKVMDLIDRKEIQVVLVWKWSRISRSRLDWAVAADRVEQAGARIESATEPLDTSTSTGRLARGMMTEFAAFESERIGDVWRESHHRRILLGLPANGKPRFGYAYDRATGFTIDPENGPVLAEMYRRYIGGESVYSLVLWANAGQSRPSTGYGVQTDGLWTDRTIRRMMDSGFGAGFISSGGELHPGAHTALIMPTEWDAYREARNRRRNKGGSERSEYLLSGLIRCNCGSRMNAGQFGSANQSKYRCKAGHEKRTHTGGYITASFVEDAVFQWLTEYNDDLTTAEANAPTAPKASRVNLVTTLTTRLTTIDRKVDALGARLIDSAIPIESYKRMSAALQADRAKVETELLTARVQAVERRAPISTDFLAGWPEIPIPERREILRSLIEVITVTPGRPHGLIEITAK
jgi:site-specific DNA recombinase